MDVIGAVAATLINEGHNYSEVGKYSLSTLFFLLESLSEKYSGKNQKTTHNEYPVHQRDSKNSRIVRVQGSGFSRQDELDDGE
jgi:hypothetical protein